jgi:hypothetical protein
MGWRNIINVLPMYFADCCCCGKRDMRLETKMLQQKQHPFSKREPTKKILFCRRSTGKYGTKMRRRKK